MGRTDPFVCLRIPCTARPGATCAPWGVRPGRRAGAALSYLTPPTHWHTIWRTLANPGE
ncbi:hypothetical protein GCM10018793_10610 [Streptomyces sulfonofaciens]|uniref:Uncharacterized protein n=1 Tax=Streptomyces sulfonofaciens TaxID=68272 RepID=A0A919KUD4_9ACTN|nr:hypothetical protein GCM10018793_10610 [Streptomyces sulfonofaciens]